MVSGELSKRLRTHRTVGKDGRREGRRERGGRGGGARTGSVVVAVAQPVLAALGMVLCKLHRSEGMRKLECSSPRFVLLACPPEGEIGVGFRGGGGGGWKKWVSAFHGQVKVGGGRRRKTEEEGGGLKDEGERVELSRCNFEKKTSKELFGEREREGGREGEREG